MKLIIKNLDNACIRSISLEKFELYQNFIAELSTIKKPATATLITSNEKINSFELKKLKLALEELNIRIKYIYSRNRETVISGNSLKIKSTLLDIKTPENELLIGNLHKKKDIIHKGTVRSGDRISSNGHLL